MSTSLVEKQEPAGMVSVEHKQTAPATIAEMIQFAIEKGLTPDGLEKLVQLHERVSDRAARQEFFDRLADFQSACPPITKDSVADITTRSGVNYHYRYAELDHIQNAVRPLLRERGFAYTWDSKTEGKMLTAVCSLRHVNGHVESAAFTLTVDSASAMSEQQKYVAALTVAKRMSLVSVLGLTTTEPDTDGNNHEPITEDQAVQLEDLIETALADKARFLKVMKVQTVRDIQQGQLNKAVTLLEAKIKEHKRGKPVKS